MRNFIAETQKVIDEIEARLMTFDLSEIAEITGVPFALYQRFFSYMCDITISSYVRQRKLTISASKLLLGEWSVTIASLECGYEDTSSFSRAFKEQFHVSPSSITIKEFKKYQCEKLMLSKFTSTVDKKAVLVSVDYPVIQEQYLVGISTTQYPDKVGASLWEIYWDKGIAEKLSSLKNDATNIGDYVAIGYMRDFEISNSLGKEYMIGRLYHDIPSNKKDLAIVKLQSMQLVHSKIRGKNINDIIDGAYPLTCDIASKNGFEIDYSSFFWIEYYNNESFGNMNNNQDDLLLDFYMPCKKIDSVQGGIQ